MPTIQNSNLESGNSRSFVKRWLAMAASDDGAPFSGSQYTDRSAQVSGTFGGATLRLQGSNDGVTWATLSDPQGNALDFTSAKIEMVTEATLFVRPLVVGGDGTTSLNVHLLLKE